MSETRRASVDDAFFWDAAAEDLLLVQRCAECGTLRHPPAPMCGHCGSLSWDTQESAGRGRSSPGCTRSTRTAPTTSRAS